MLGVCASNRAKVVLANESADPFAAAFGRARSTLFFALRCGAFATGFFVCDRAFVPSRMVRPFHNLALFQNLAFSPVSVLSQVSALAQVPERT
jgi:hypothetical protein